MGGVADHLGDEVGILPDKSLRDNLDPIEEGLELLRSLFTALKRSQVEEQLLVSLANAVAVAVCEALERR